MGKTVKMDVFFIYLFLIVLVNFKNEPDNSPFRVL